MPEVTFKAKSDVTMAEKRKWVESQLPDDAAVERIYKRCMRTRVNPELPKHWSKVVDLLEGPDVYHKEPLYDAADPLKESKVSINDLVCKLDPDGRYNHKLGHEVTTVFLRLVSIAKDKISDLAEDAQGNAIVAMHSRKDAPQWSQMLKGAGLVLSNAAMPAFTEALREMRSVGESGSASE
jgi:hypothetical protein